MPLYSYTKAPVSPKKRNYKELVINDNRKTKWNITLGELLIGFYNDFHRLMSTSKIAALVVPTILVVTGVYVIYRQVWPQVFQMIEASTGKFDNSTTALVEGDYIALDTQYSNPGAKYFADLRQSAEDQNLLFTDKKSADYKGTFRLSIPSLGFDNLKVSANVDSSVEKVYDQLLTDGLAHFQGTNLPHTDQSAYNVVIYGHSSAGDYYERTKDPAAAFSRLSQLKYGNEIYMDFEGKTYKYKFIKGEIVNANDLSILEGNRGKKTLTLFTCYPNGNNGKRFVATAQLVED